MPSSSSCTATNEPTAIISELSKSKKITISENGLKIPTHKFYGDRSMPLPLLMTQPTKVEQIENGKLECKRNVNGSDLVSVEGTSNTMNRSHPFRMDDEVLAELDGGNFYLGTIVDRKNDSVLLRFANGTDKWAPISKLTKLNINEKNPMCIVCKEYDEIVQVCSQCHRGFHKKCTTFSKSDECSADSWCCYFCSTSIEAEERRMSVEKPTKTTETSSGCYCGERGDWFMQMLQCARCLQWFHAKCITCLNFPLYFGDRFYLFACARCNHGVEFLRRLHMNVEEVVHLLLFNLTLQFRKRYYHSTNVIYPYARDNWHALQLPPKLKNWIASVIKDEIMKALRSNKDRFKPGNEVKNKVLNWALVSRTPPKAPNIVLPPGPLLTEKYINDLFKEEARIDFLPQNIHNPSEVTFNDAKIKDLMAGKNVASHIITSEDTTSSDDMDSGAFSSTSDDDILANFRITDQFGIHIKGCTQDESTQPFAEKSTIKGRKSSLPQLGQSEKSNDTSLDFNYSSDDTFTLDAIIPPPKNFSGINNPFLIDTNACQDSRSFGTSTSVKTTLFKFTPNSENMQPSSTLNKNQVQMVRTVKRRLSANDIIIGPNMEVKRRKLKKRLENVEVISTSSLADLPKSATYLPISADSKRISMSALRSTLKDLPSKTKSIEKKRGTSLDSNIFGEQSNSTTMSNQTDSQSITTTSTSLISSISSSPIKETLKEESMAKLQSSLSILFGGVDNRIANGENYAIRGKRILSDGRLQYLIDWDKVS